VAMSRKHYVEVAGILAAERAMAREKTKGPEAAEGWAVLEATRNLTLSLADMFKRDNGGFQREKFYDAAGVSAPYTATGEVA
jgi:hypothetical protein